MSHTICSTAWAQTSTPPLSLLRAYFHWHAEEILTWRTNARQGCKLWTQPRGSRTQGSVPGQAGRAPPTGNPQLSRKQRKWKASLKCSASPSERGQELDSGTWLGGKSKKEGYGESQLSWPIPPGWVKNAPMAAGPGNMEISHLPSQVWAEIWDAHSRVKQVKWWWPKMHLQTGLRHSPIWALSPKGK